MNRQPYYDEISEKLEVLSYRIKRNGKLNILDLNIHAEIFYRDLLNCVYGHQLKSANILTATAEAIDLIDDQKKLVIQVSSTATKQKIENTLSKDTILEHARNGYRIKFVFIADEAQKLRSKSYSNPHKITFIAAEDILDKGSLLTEINQLSIEKYLLVYELFRKEFSIAPMPDLTTIPNNLAKIVKLLVEEDLEEGGTSSPNLNQYNIDEKIIHNDLEAIKETSINEYMQYHSMLDRLYKEFDQQGKNNRISVLRKITSFYEKELSNTDSSNLEKYLKIVNDIKDYISNSNNLNDIEEDIIEMCVKIIVVDAFIRCKIFKNPKGYNHVAS